MSSTSVAATVVPQVVKATIWPAASPSSSVPRNNTANQHHPHQLKKQKSLIDSVIVTNYLSNIPTNMASRRATFQKQRSVDQVNLSNSVRTWTNSAVNITSTNNNNNTNSSNLTNNNNNQKTCDNGGNRSLNSTNSANITNNKKRQQNIGKNE